MKKVFSLFFLIAILFSCSNQEENNIQKSAKINWQNAPGKPEIFLDGFLSTGLFERDFTITPDGNTIFYTIQLPKTNFSVIAYATKNINGYFINPEIASFSGVYADLEPFFHPNGNELFFASNRPKNTDGKQPEEDFDIWKVTFQDGGFGKPERLPNNINSYTDDFYPAIANNGNLYFTSTRDNGIGKEDIFVARKTKNGYQDPIPLSEAINSNVYDFNSFVSPNEDLIMFSSVGRAKGPGKGDMYFSTKTDSGTWKPAKLLSSPINSKYLDFCPYYDSENQVLIFSSERTRFEGPQKITSLDSLNQVFALPQNGMSDLYWVKWTSK